MTTTIQDPATSDPRTAEPAPPYEQERIAPPGGNDAMRTRPDCGETSYRGLDRLRGRRALVTGGDSGIGRAVAIAFAREGADVALAYLPEEEDDARETARWVEDAGRTCVRLPGDITDAGHCARIVDEAIARLGGLDLLVNNAAYQMTRDALEEITPEEFDRTFKTNVYAMFWLCHAALGRMPAGSAIINTTSIQALDPSAELLPYAATKAAIANFTKGLAPLAMKRGVRVDAVAPGPVWTPLVASTMPEQKIRSFGSTTAFGRAAQPVEIAPVFVFLASNEARFVTGEVYGITGGQTPL